MNSNGGKNQPGNQQSEGRGGERPTSGSSNKVEFSLEYAKSNKEKIITYILLILGLFLLFFNNMLGGLLIGVVAGYYFDTEIIYYIRNLTQIISGQEHTKYVVLTALILGLLIAAPGIFIGAVIIAVFKQVLFNRSSS